MGGRTYFDNAGNIVGTSDNDSGPGRETFFDNAGHIIGTSYSPTAELRELEEGMRRTHEYVESVLGPSKDERNTECGGPVLPEWVGALVTVAIIGISIGLFVYVFYPCYIHFPNDEFLKGLGGAFFRIIEVVGSCVALYFIGRILLAIIGGPIADIMLLLSGLIKKRGKNKR